MAFRIRAIPGMIRAHLARRLSKQHAYIKADPPARQAGLSLYLYALVPGCLFGKRPEQPSFPEVVEGENGRPDRPLRPHGGP